MSLNESLTEAIALGHDLGHTPFGHSGEHVLNQLNPGGFIHCDQSVRVVEILEKKGQGLNLTWEVRDGIRNHRTSGIHPRWKADVFSLRIRLLILIMILMMRNGQGF